MFQLFKVVSTVTQQSACTAHSFFGLEPWWQYLGKAMQTTTDANGQSVCKINFTVLGSKSDIPLILLAVIDDMLRVAGLVALGFIIYGAFQYVTSQGSADKTARAQNTIIDALVGLVVATIAVAFVAFLGNKLGS